MMLGKSCRFSRDSALNRRRILHPETVKWNSKILGQEGGAMEKKNRRERERIVLAMAGDLFIVLAVD